MDLTIDDDCRGLVPNLSLGVILATVCVSWDTPELSSAISKYIHDLQLSVKSLEYQKAMLKGGERMTAAMKEGGAAPEGEMPNPALWAWNMMAQASKDMMEQVGKNVAESAKAAEPAKKKAGKKKG